MTTTQTWMRSASGIGCVLAIASGALALTACDDKGKKISAGQELDHAIAQTEQAAVAAGRKAAELAETARDKTVAFAKSPEVRRDVAAAKDAVKRAGDKLDDTPRN